MATQTADPRRALTDAAHHFESYATAAQSTIGGRAIFWFTLSASARAAGLDPAQLDPRMAERQERATAQAIHWQRWVNELFAGRAELVPYQIGNNPIRLAVRAIRPGPLGWWPIALTVVRYASAAALTAAGYLSIDAWQETQQTVAEARKLDAESRAKLTVIAQSDPSLAPKIAHAMQAADQAAAGAGPTWIDRITGGMAAGAAGGIGSGLMLLAAFWLFSQSQNRKKNPTRRRTRRRSR